MSGKTEVWGFAWVQNLPLNELMFSRDHMDLGQTSIIILDLLLNSHGSLEVPLRF